MMKKQQIEQWVRSILDGSVSASLSIHPESPYEHYIYNCAKRLERAFALWQRDQKYLGDFLIVLRNYLLTLKTEISLIPGLPVEQFDRYGLWVDPETGVIKASYKLPNYLDSFFTQTAFLSDAYDAVSKDDDGQYNLLTDPMVFQLTGFSRFRSLAQKLSLHGALNTPDGYTTLISMPTGGGKSLITQLVSYQKEGLTIIVVPTVSLAIDQVRVARAIIKKAKMEEICYYSSGVNPAAVIKSIKEKKLRMLFISPEALILNSGFVEAIAKANASRYLKNIIIDEAHIVVDWGADFRIDYQCLESWRKKLILHNPQIRTFLLSATFERRCRDILKDFFSEEKKWIEIRCDSLRHEPRFMLVKCKSVREKNSRIVELVRKCPHPMVIYVARPFEAEKVKDLLQRNGIVNVNTFTGLTGTTKRQELIRSWVNDEFDVMVATSAFGVGVDKGDIRTVLHAYVPQNPNAYYQELGRGGRDQLPCLSIVCMVEDDIAVSFQRISKKVMTTEKIIGRWDSLYNNDLSIRIGNHIMIDTTIKPKYAVEDLLEDSPSSEADIRWNVYVLLLLRRYNKIRIDEVIAKKTGYTFVIEILDDNLRNNDSKLKAEIESIRAKEWKYYTDAFALMREAIRNNGKECWSEMFFETYDRVLEYCAGCAAHKLPNLGDYGAFSLKSSISEPQKELKADQLALFGDATQLIIQSRADAFGNVIKGLSKYRLASLVVPRTMNYLDIFSDDVSRNGLLIYDINELGELVKMRSWFFVSGIIAVLYHGSCRDIYKQLMTVTNELQHHPWIRVIHILEENTYFDWIGKSFSDLVNGRSIQADALKSL